MVGSGLTALVANIYEAACDPSRIEPFVEDAAAYFSAQRAAFVLWPVDNPEAFLPVTYGISKKRLCQLFEERNDPDTLFWQLAKQPPGTVFPSSARLSADVSAQALAGLVDAGDANRCALVMVRDPDRDEFSHSEQEALQTLISYFRRSLLLNKRFVRLFSLNRIALMLLEHSPHGIAIFGQRGQLTFQNAEARRIFSLADSFRIEDGNLQILDDNIHRRLYDLLQQAREAHDARIGAHRLSTRIPRSHDKPALQMLVYGLPFKASQAAFDDEESLAVMLIIDPSGLAALDVELLQDFFGFTAAEANLAHTLHHGVPLTAAAEALRISVNTARTQLRSMFKKTGVNSQAELLQEFCTSPRLNIQP